MKRLLTLLLPMMAAMAVSAQTNVVVINDVELSNGEAIVSIPLRNTTPLREVEAKFRVFTDELGFETDAAGNPVLYINSDRANGHTYSVTTDEITINSRTAVDVEFTITSSNAFNGTNGEIAHFKLIDKGNWTNDYSDVKYAATGTDMNGQTMNLYTEGQSAIFKVTRPQQTGIAIDETNFPDPVFRQWVLTNYNDGNGYLDQARAEALTTLNVGSQITDGSQIASLKGIEYFTGLTYLYCSDCQLTALDVSHNTALTRLYCYRNQLTALDVSNNTALILLSCDYNQLTALDVSNNTALTTLHCDNNQLTALDVSHNTALNDLMCNYNQLTALDVSGCTALTRLQCNYNQLTALDVSNNTALTLFNCFGNLLTHLDVSNNTALTSFNCTYNPLLSLNLSNTQVTAVTTISNNTKRFAPYKATVNGVTKYYFYINDETKGDHQSLSDLIHAVQGGNYFDMAQVTSWVRGGAVEGDLFVLNEQYGVKYKYNTGNNTVGDVELEFISANANAIQDSENPFVKNVKSVDVAGISLPKGITSEIDLSILPDDATNKDIVWASSDDSIVSVDQNGVVTTNAIGTATITATAADEGGAAVALTVNVTAAQVTFDLNQDGEVTVGDVSLLYAKILGLVD